jgi:hypothetical protein
MPGGWIPMRLCGYRFVYTDRHKVTVEDLDVLQLTTCKEAEDVTQALQIHFFCSPSRERSSRIPPDFLTRALELALHLLPHMKSGSKDYIREKLNTRNPSLSAAIGEAITKSVSANSRWAVLEHNLRVVIKLLRDAQTLNATELQYVERLLTPLWEFRAANLTLQKQRSGLVHLLRGWLSRNP